jgi:putative flippase GtrA
MQHVLENIVKYSFFQFSVIGGISTCIDFIIYMLLSSRISIAKAKIISICCASVFSFFLNRTWTFSDRSELSFLQLAKYLAVQAINIAANVIVNSVAYHFLGNKVISFILATGAAMTINFLLQKELVFKVGTSR